MSHSWTSKHKFLTRSKPIPHKVNGEELKFYPASVGCLFELKDMAQAIGKLVAAVFADTRNDAGSEDSTDGEFRRVASLPVTLEVAKYRVESRGQAYADLLEATVKPETRKALGTLFMDSIRDEFKDDCDKPPAIEFVGALSAEGIVDMCIGVFKANKDLFGPLAGKIEKLVGGTNTLLDRMAAKVNEASSPETAGKISTAKSSGAPIPSPSKSASPSISRVSGASIPRSVS